MTDSEQIAAKVEAFMRGEGLTDEPDQYDGSMHSWRCEYPDRYGKCDCFQTFRDDLTALVTEVARAAAEKAWDECRVASGELVNTGARYSVEWVSDLTNPYRLEQTDD